ncbi:hypothetical protein R6Q59_023526 [Mikania micrantha]
MAVGAQHNIDWAVLAEVGQAERVMAILVEDTLWNRLFDTVDVPTYRLIIVEFLSTFRYRAHQALVAEQDDEFSLRDQHFDMVIERFVVLLGIYYKPETVTDVFVQGQTQGEDGVMRAWWPQISTAQFRSHRVHASTIRDPLIRYIHRRPYLAASPDGRLATASIAGAASGGHYRPRAASRAAHPLTATAGPTAASIACLPCGVPHLATRCVVIPYGGTD